MNMKIISQKICWCPEHETLDCAGWRKCDHERIEGNITGQYFHVPGPECPLSDVPEATQAKQAGVTMKDLRDWLYQYFPRQETPSPKEMADFLRAHGVAVDDADDAGKSVEIDGAAIVLEPDYKAMWDALRKLIPKKGAYEIGQNDLNYIERRHGVRIEQKEK
jgi:hypothetical protein